MMDLWTKQQRKLGAIIERLEAQNDAFYHLIMGLIKQESDKRTKHKLLEIVDEILKMGE